MTPAPRVRPRILIVEDEQIVAADLQQSLQDLGYEVISVAETAGSAIQTAQEQQPDLVLMDIQLKGKMDGITAAEEIANRWQIPVVFVTANTNEEVFSRSKAAGPYGYLMKPFRTKELNATVLVALQQNRRVHELFSERAWLRTMLDSMSDGVIAMDAQARIQYLNPAASQLTGWPLEEARGKPIGQVFVVTTLTGEPVYRCCLQQALAESKPMAKSRFLLCSREGRQIPIEDSASPILEAGRTTGAISVFLEITERLGREREAEDEWDHLEEQMLATNEALGHTRAELRALAGHLMTEQEEEARRVARELHDDFGQRTALLEFQASKLSELVPNRSEAAKILEMMRAQILALSEAQRELSYKLHPSIVSDLGLVVGLRNLALDFQTAGLNVTFHCNRSFVEAPIEISTALYRICQEGLVNAGKHANREPVHITLTATERELQLAIEDKGPGFDLAHARAKGGLGLVSMNERARAVGGSMLLRSAPGQGTQILIRVPLN